MLETLSDHIRLFACDPATGQLKPNSRDLAAIVLRNWLDYEVIGQEPVLGLRCPESGEFYPCSESELLNSAQTLMTGGSYIAREIAEATKLKRPLAVRRLMQNTVANIQALEGTPRPAFMPLSDGPLSGRLHLFNQWLAHLLANWSLFSEGKTVQERRHLCITGEPGRGKSTLANALRACLPPLFCEPVKMSVFSKAFNSSLANSLLLHIDDVTPSETAKAGNIKDALSERNVLIREKGCPPTLLPSQFSAIFLSNTRFERLFPDPAYLRRMLILELGPIFLVGDQKVFYDEAYFEASLTAELQWLMANSSVGSLFSDLGHQPRIQDPDTLLFMETFKIFHKAPPLVLKPLLNRIDKVMPGLSAASPARKGAKALGEAIAEALGEPAYVSRSNGEQTLYHVAIG